MTNHARGSSLLQARKSHLHLHRHSHNSNNIIHDRKVNHVHSHEEVHRRQIADLESVVTEVVQTVSVVQYIDENGSLVDVQTIFSPPVTQLVDQSTGLTVSAPNLDGVLPTLSVQVPGLDTPAPTTVDSKSDYSAAGQEATPLTSAPSSSSSTFSPSPGVFNSTSTDPLFNNSTQLHSLFANTTRSSSSFTSLRSSTFNSLTSKSSSSKTPGVTIFGGDGGSGGSENTAATLPTTSSNSGGESGHSGPPTTTVVGGVLGGVAGIAVVLLVALALLRWKKRQQNGHRLLGDGETSSSSRVLEGPTGSGGGGTGDMTERGSLFAVPATLAALSGHKRNSQATSARTDSSERGFYRISGRKLPSVLQHGGDGFNDPRNSTISGTSFYRDSKGDWGGTSTPRFAVGSPMRPESGIPVMQPGPGRTPVRTPITEQGPVFEHLHELTPPSSLDPIGRSHASQDGSRGSGSRFTEDI